MVNSIYQWYYDCYCMCYTVSCKWISVFFLLLLLFTFFLATSYIVTVLKGLIYPIWPMVSDAGAILPAASYFSTFLDIIAALSK